MMHDLRYAIRVLLRSPGFALTAIVSIGLGIGANTAIFSFVNAVLLRNLPVKKPEQLVTLSSTLSPELRATSYSLPFYQELRDNNTALSGLLARANATISLAYGDM